MSGFNGVTIESKSAVHYRTIKGFAGIQIEIAGLPVKVTDRKGRGLFNCKITVSNPGGTPREAFTDSDGNALVATNGANPNPIIAEKENAFTTSNYTTGSTFTIVLEPPPIL
jgi:hypothetical protein